MTKRSITYAALATLTAVTIPLNAQPRVFTTGLLNPAKIIQGPSGSLLVSEFDNKPNSGRISIVSSTGTRRTLIDGLPSGVGANGPDGPTGLALDGNTLYVAIGEGDQLENGTAQGTAIPNTKGPASPILATILQLNLAGPVDKITTGFTLKAADHAVLADGNSVSLDNGAGDKATLSMLSEFRYRPDPVAIYRNSHPYALAKVPGDANHLYLADAGLNALVQVDLPSGRSRKFTAFPNQPNRGPIGPPVSEAVPNSIQLLAGRLMVTLLTGFPFATGNSKVMLVDPTSGSAEVLLENLTNTIDIAWRSRFFGGVDFYVLEFSTDLLNNAPGRLKLINAGDSSVVADKLPGPSSMVLDNSASTLYILTKSGSILQLDLPK
jgi:hypothetical protein